MRELTLEELELTTGLRELTSEELELIAGGYDTRYNDGGDGWDVVGDRGDSDSGVDRSDYYGDTGDYGEYGDGGDTGADTGPEAPNDTNPPQVTVEILNPANAAKVYQAMAAMEQKIAAITEKANALPDGARIRMPDGSEISGKDFKDLWGKIDYKVTDRTFGTDRAGAYDAATGVATFNADQALGWDLWTGGMAFILLHEVAHSSSMGRAVDAQQWQAHLDNGGNLSNYDSTSPYFQENEEFSNMLALELTATLGLELHPQFEPTNGYEYGDLAR